jgi:hypothetical protein
VTRVTPELLGTSGADVRGELVIRFVLAVWHQLGARSTAFGLHVVQFSLCLASRLLAAFRSTSASFSIISAAGIGGTER